MDKFDVLKEVVSEKLFQQEPLAAAIILYLNKSDPAAHREIVDLFDNLIAHRMDLLLQEALDNEVSAKIDGFN